MGLITQEPMKSLGIKGFLVRHGDLVIGVVG